MVQLILILANIFELAESYISADITPNENISISPLQITCAWLSFGATLKLIVYARVCELYDKAGKLATATAAEHTATFPTRSAPALFQLLMVWFCSVTRTARRCLRAIETVASLP